MCMCLMCGCVHMSASACGGDGGQRCQNSLAGVTDICELPVWLLCFELNVLSRAACALNAEQSPAQPAYSPLKLLNQLFDH